MFDLPALREILAGVARREIAIHSVETVRSSPFASSLLFDYVAAYMYDGDAPLAERRAGALTLDRDLLRELLGQEELRELLDPEALADLELSLQALTEDRQATTLDQLHDLLRRLGDLGEGEIAARTAGHSLVATAWLQDLAASRRAVTVRIGGVDRWVAVEDVARYRDAIGVSVPVGIPGAFLEPTQDALGSLLARWARTHGPFLTPEPARRWGLPVGIVEDALERAVAAGSLLRGEFRPGGAEREWCDPDVLRLLRRRSLARLRHEVEPVDPAALGTLASGLARDRGRRRERRHRSGARPRWNASPRSSTSWPACRCRPRSWSATSCRPGSRATSRDCSTSWAPSARSPGWATVRWVATTVGSPWSGRVERSCGPIGPADGLEPPTGERHDAIRAHLAQRGASFYRELFAAAGGGLDRDVLDALWDLVWAGEVTNDTFAPLRALRWKRTASGGNRARRASAA